MKIKNKTDKQTTTSSCQIQQSNKQHYCKSMSTQNNTVYSRTKEKQYLSNLSSDKWRLLD